MLCKVIVGNLDYRVGSLVLFGYFSRFDEVVGLDMPLDAWDVIKNRGYCFVNYAGEKAIDKVLGTRHVVNDEILWVEPSNKTMPNPKRTSYTVFVGNLDYNMKKEELLKYFDGFGEVIGLHMPFDTEDGIENGGCCFVRYANKKTVDEVLEAKHILKNKTLHVGPPDNGISKAYKMLCKVVVQNLDHDMKREELLDHFKTFGEISGLFVPLNHKDSTRNNWYCFVTYVDIETVDEVLRAEHTLKNEILDVG